MHWILQKVLGLDPSVLQPGAEWSFRVGAAWAGALWVVLLVLLGALIYSAVIYRKEGRPITPGFRAFLAALRVLVLSILILLLCEPILAVEEVELNKPYVIFMIDTSQSMNLRDRFPEEETKDDSGAIRKSDVERARAALPADYKSPEGLERDKLGREELAKLSRMDFVNAVIKGQDTDPRKTGLGNRYHLRFYEFNSDIRPEYAKAADGQAVPSEAIDPGTSLADRPGSNETRLGDCLRKVLNDLRGQTVVGVVMLTDGRSNAGDDPREAAKLARPRSIPLYPVGVGDRRILDVEVRRIEAPERAYAGDFAKFTATLVQKGFAGHKATVTLRRGKEELDRKSDVVLPEDGRAFQVELRFKPKDEDKGKADYTIEVDNKPGELVTDNNNLTHALTVIEGKIKVLYVEGQDLPRYEYRFLKHAMMRDHTLQVTTLLAQSDGSFFDDSNYEKDKSYPTTEKDLFEKYDVVIFGDVDPEIFTEEQLAFTRKFVENGGGFMMIAGERHAPMKYLGDPAKKPIAPLIPVIIEPADDAFIISLGGRTITEPFKPKVTPNGWASPVMRLENDEPANQALWNKADTEGGLPGFFWYLPVSKAKSTASVLLIRPADPGEVGSKERPLVVTERYGAGLTMFVGTDEFWRWRFGRGDRYFYRFYAQAIQFLASARGGKTKTSVLTTDWPVYSLGERVTVTAEVKVASAGSGKVEPYKGESVTVHYSMEGLGEQPPVKLSKVPGADGRYTGQIAPKGRGRYHAWVSPVDGSADRGGECDFEVKLPQLEYEDPRMDEDLLKDMAKRGGDGGKFLNLDEVRELDKLITEPERRRSVPHEHFLWDNWRLFAFFCVVIIAEWVLRKRARML